jgi:hypothetical protein
MSGEMRRPPQLWEQRLARTTSVLGVGLSAGGDATAIVTPTPAPGSGGGVEPAPVLPPPGDFIAPSTPTLISSVQGINVVWNGLNSAGDLWPADTSYVEVHMSTAGTGFTPDATTLRGRLARPGGLAVTGLTAGTTYHFRLRGADPAGNVTTAGSAASAQPGLITAPDIAANAITANSIVAGTITGWSINAAFLSGGTVSGGFITGGTVEGARFQTRAGGSRIRIDDDVVGPYGTNDAIEFIGGGNSRAIIAWDESDELLDFYSPYHAFYSRTGGTTTVDVSGTLEADTTVFGTLTANTSMDISFSGGNRALRVNGTGEVFSYGIDDNTTANAANVRVGANAQLLRSTSTQRVKDHIISLGGDLAGVDPAKVSDEAASVNPYDVLNVAPVEFQSLAPTDDGQRLLGFIAENVAEVFPWAAEWDDTGQPSSVADRPILAALLAVVRDQAATITDLTARIEALEA